MNTVQLLDRVIGLNTDDSGKPIFSDMPVPELGLTKQLQGRRFGLLEDKYVSPELNRILRDDFRGAIARPDTFGSKLGETVADLWGLSVKSGRTAAIFSWRLATRNIVTNTLYPILSGDFARKGHLRNQAEGFKLAKEAHQFMAGRIKPGTERYNKFVAAMKEMADADVYHIGRGGMSEDLNVFAQTHGFPLVKELPVVGAKATELIGKYSQALDSARQQYSLADLPYKYAMWKNALETFNGDKVKAAEHVHRFGQYADKLGRGLRGWSKLPFADFPQFFFDSHRIFFNATVDFMRNTKNLGRGGDWRQVVGYLAGVSIQAAITANNFKMFSKGAKTVKDQLRKVVGEETGAEFGELTDEQEGDMYALVPEYDKNNPTLFWKETDKQGKVTLHRVPMRGTTSPIPNMDIVMGSINTQARQAGGLNALLSDPQKTAELPLIIAQEYARSLLQTGMIPQAWFRTLFGREYGLMGASSYQSPEGGALGLWQSVDPKKNQKIAKLMASQAAEVFPPLFLPQSESRKIKRMLGQFDKAQEGDPAAQQTITDIIQSSTSMFRHYTLDTEGARKMYLQSGVPLAQFIREEKRKEQPDLDSMKTAYSGLIELQQRADRLFVQTGLIEKEQLNFLLVNSLGLSRQEAASLIEYKLPPDFKKQINVTNKEKYMMLGK